jgi:hypothetical protein
MRKPSIFRAASGARSKFRLTTAVTTAAMLVSFGSMVGARAIDPADDFSATPGLACGAGDLPEATQGRVPHTDFESGRAAQGDTCNASQVSQVGNQDLGTGGAGGYRVFRYVDNQNQTCAFFDTTLLFPANLAQGPGNTGVWVLDMRDPANPVHTATLSTPAMQSPHESLSLNERRGLLGAVFSNPVFYHGQFDLYDVSQDCTHPTLKSTLPVGFLGHEGSFAPDGNTYYSASLYGHTLAAIDTTEPLATKPVWSTLKYNVHGLNLSEDGNTLYFADKGNNSIPGAGSATPGLTVLDVSQVQARALNPQVSEISHLTWPHVGTPQTDLPVSIGGHSYLVEIDEFGGADNVGAARIINVDSNASPFVVSNIRLAVNNVEHQNDPDQQKDPNATNSLGGYKGHYCGVPSKTEPGIVACSFILSGLRVFDIHDPLHPVEIAYFNKPATVAKPGAGPVPYGAQGSYAMSQPAFDVANHQIWYSDGNSGLFVVQINNGVWH